MAQASHAQAGHGMRGSPPSPGFDGTSCDVNMHARLPSTRHGGERMPVFPSSLDASDVRRMLAGPRAAYRQVSERAHRPAWHGVNRPTDDLAVGLLGPANEMNTNRRWISQLSPFGISVGLSRGHFFLQLFVSHASSECRLLWHRRRAVGCTAWVHALSHTLCQPTWYITSRYQKLPRKVTRVGWRPSRVRDG